MTAPRECAHVAHFYDDGASLSTIVTPYLKNGLERRESVVLISTAERRDDLFARLFDAPAHAPRERGVVWLDARTTLARLFPHGEPDERRFAEIVATEIERGIADSPAGRVCAFGEMVGLLAEEGRFEAAAQLERLWNRTLEAHAFSLFCAYPATAFPANGRGRARATLSALHTEVVPPQTPRGRAGRGLERRESPRDRESRARRRTENEMAMLADASAALVRSLVSTAPPDAVAPAGASAPIMIWASGLDKSCHYFNEGWLAFTGRTLEQEVGNGWAEGVHPEDLAACVDTYSRAFDRRAAFRMEYRIRRFDGEYRRILDAGQPRLAADGTFLGYIGGCIDVTEPRAAERARADLHDRLETAAHEWTRAFDSLSLGVFVIDDVGFVRRLNRTALALTGGTHFDQVIGRSFAAMGWEEPWLTARDLLAELAAGRPSSRAIRSPGPRQWEVGATPMITEAGARRWSIVTIHDTTEVANLQEALRRSESMAALGTLVSGVAHEVRNPLFGILATLQLFEGRLRSQPGFEECRTLLQANVQRLLELMQELLDYARPMQAAFAEADLGAVVEQAVGACLAVAGQRDVTIRNAVSPQLAPFRMDRRRLVQVFQNVISNAVAFSPAGTTVTVSARLAGGDVCCEIEDCGPGFTAEEMPHVFEPFFTRRRDGTGLGLSIARRIVEAHAGTIAAANRPSMTGGLICITLPRSGAPPEPGR